MSVITNSAGKTAHQRRLRIWLAALAVMLGTLGLTAAASPAHAAATSSTYQFSGFFAPVDNPPALNVRNAGSTVPIQFSLGGNQGLNIFAPGSPTSRRVDCTTLAPLAPTTPVNPAGNSGLAYDPGSDTYTFTYQTSKIWAGTCGQIDVALNDGTHHAAYFSVF